MSEIALDNTNYVDSLSQYLQIPQASEDLKNLDVIIAPMQFLSYKVFKALYRSSQLYMSTLVLIEKVARDIFEKASCLSFLCLSQLKDSCGKTAKILDMTYIPYANSFKKLMSMSRFAECWAEWNREYTLGGCVDEKGVFNQEKFDKEEKEGIISLRRLGWASGAIARTLEVITYFKINNALNKLQFVAYCVDKLAKVRFVSTLVTFGCNRGGYLFTVLFYAFYTCVDIKKMGLGAFKNRGTIEKIGKSILFITGGTLVPGLVWRFTMTYIVTGFVLDVSRNYGFYSKCPLIPKTE